MIAKAENTLTDTYARMSGLRKSIRELDSSYKSDRANLVAQLEKLQARIDQSLEGLDADKVALAEAAAAVQQHPAGAPQATASAESAAPASRCDSVKPSIFRTVSIAQSAPADEPATLRLGQINERLAPISLSAAGLAELGIDHSATDRAAKLYRESDFVRICEALIKRIEQAYQMEAA